MPDVDITSPGLTGTVCLIRSSVTPRAGRIDDAGRRFGIATTCSIVEGWACPEHFWDRPSYESLPEHRRAMALSGLDGRGTPSPTKPSGNGASRSGSTLPADSAAGANYWATRGTLMGCSSRSTGVYSTCGEPSTRTAMSSISWCSPDGTDALRSVSFERS